MMTWWVAVQALCPGLKPAYKCSGAWRWGCQSTGSARKWVWLQAGCEQQEWTRLCLWDPHQDPTSFRSSSSNGQPISLQPKYPVKGRLWSLAQANGSHRWQKEVGNLCPRPPTPDCRQHDSPGPAHVASRDWWSGMSLCLWCSMKKVLWGLVWHRFWGLISTHILITGTSRVGACA